MRTPAGTRRRILVGGAVLSASTLLAACGSATGETAVTHHPLQRPAPADDRRARQRLREGDRHHGQGPQRRRGHLRRRDRRGGSRSPADVFYTENSPRSSTSSTKGLLATVDPSTLAKTPSQYNSPRGLGRGLGAGERAHLQPEPDQEDRSCRRGPAAGRPRSTRASWPSPPARPTSNRSSPRSSHATVRRRRCVAGRHQGQRRQPHLPRQRDDRRRGQPGRGRVRRRQPVLLVPDARRDRASNIHSRSRTSRRTIRATCSTSRARASSSRRKHQAAAQKFLAFLVSARGRRSSPTRSASSTRSPRA